MRGSILFGAILFSVAAGCAFSASGTSERAESKTTDLIGGTPTQSAGTSALYLANGFGGCTATMIGSNQILTAAHCVVDQVNGVITTSINASYKKGISLAVTNSSSIVDPNENWFTATVVNTDLNPDFVTACAAGCPQNFSLLRPYPADLAIITLAATFPGNFGLASMIDDPHVGDAVSEVGYGCEVKLGGPPPSPARFKTAPATIVDPTGPMPASFQVADIAAFSQNYFVTLGQSGGGAASLCPGDSGGPLFKGSFTNGGDVVGVNAYYTFPASAPGVSDVNVFARMDSPAVSAWMSRVLSAYPAPTQTLDRGDPINEDYNPVSSLFPQSTVTLETGGTPGCTGVILSATKILTAAHCQADSSTIVTFYPTTAGAGAFKTATQISATGFGAVQDGVVCDPRTTGSYPDTCYSGTGSLRHYADLAVITLASTIPAGPYLHVNIGPSGSFNAAAKSGAIPSWQVATGGGGSMQWAPTYQTSSANDNLGYFTMKSTFGSLGDLGGPLYQAPGPDAGATLAGLYNITLAGIASSMDACVGANPCDTHITTYTSVEYAANYDWLMQQGASAAPDIATFGASL